MLNTNGIFGSIKSKFGFGSRNAANDDVYDEDLGYDDYEEYDEYDDYDGYDDYGYEEDSYDRTYTAANSPYGSFGNRNKVTTRGVAGSLPRLVSREDAVESTRSPRSTSSRSGGRTMVDSSLPASMTPEGTAAVSAASNRRSQGGLDSLFGPTSSSVSPRTSTDKRNLQIIKAISFDDAEGVTRALKLGNVAVLVLGSSDDALSQRILDFSFGAASALDATVECIARKTFAITKDGGLKDSEREELSALGVI